MPKCTSTEKPNKYVKKNKKGHAGRDSNVYLSFSLSLRNFSRHALELEGAHESDLPLQQEKTR